MAINFNIKRLTSLVDRFGSGYERGGEVEAVDDFDFAGFFSFFANNYSGTDTNQV